MLYIDTGEDILDAMVKSIASRYTDASSPSIAVCAEGKEFPANARRLIVIYSDKSYTSGELHGKWLRRFGDNYISLCRPVSVRLLEDILRRLSRPENCNSRLAASLYDSATRTLTKNGNSATLTPKESELYLILREMRGKPITREALRRRLWKDTDGTNAPDVIISYLRRKLTKVLGDGCIINVRGQGYILKDE
ncbi:MAG: winged helix-turn-helix transcriptional regulator [Clostridia bacterium]|nr:winged helix-turn-helix transcriptional regulator [Clostridia bacterium]